MSSAGSSPIDALRLDGRTVMVSGCNGGIGRAVVSVLSAAGARISSSDLKVDEGKDGDTLQTSADLSEPSDAARWVERTIEAFRSIDGLVNVAGLWRSTAFTDIDAAELSMILGANLLTTWNACQAVVPSMVNQGYGAIVNFASTAGQYGSIRPGAHYAAAKGAVIALTKTLARELTPLGIRVNAISPGPVDTSAAGSGVAFDDEEIRKRTLVGRAGRPEEIAHGVLFLLSDGASFATGTVLNVNGGALL